MLSLLFPAAAFGCTISIQSITCEAGNIVTANSRIQLGEGNTDLSGYVTTRGGCLDTTIGCIGGAEQTHSTAEGCTDSGSGIYSCVVTGALPASNAGTYVIDNYITGPNQDSCEVIGTRVTCPGALEEHVDYAKFQQFIVDHERVYDNMEEYATKFKTFRQTLRTVADRNKANMIAGGKGNVHGVTRFADMTQEEFKGTFLMRRGEEGYLPRVHEEKIVEPLRAGNVDWRKQGVVTPVKNQAQCGSCWAFSAIEAVESFGALQKSFPNNITALSTEQACSCTYHYNGCNGGNPQNVYDKAIAKHGGEEASATYPYIMDCASCDVDESAPKLVTTPSYTNAKYGSLQTVLDTVGPPSVCVAADSWNTYTGGVLKSCPGETDHCVQAVGYSNDGGEAYWLVRNSWGTKWGEEGYIYLAMEGDTCMVQDDINYPATAAV